MCEIVAVLHGMASVAFSSPGRDHAVGIEIASLAGDSSVSDRFRYALPADRIAQEPVEPRSKARLMDASGSCVVHRRVFDLARVLSPGDVLVLNRTRVVRSRLELRKQSGGAAELLLLEEVEGAGRDVVRLGSSSGGREALYRALVRPGRRIRAGTVLELAGEQAAVVESEALGADRSRLVRILDTRIIDTYGLLALPPYIHKPLADPARYQTVYATSPGSVAAPTAGLHLTRELLAECVARGVKVAEVDLAIGIATFRPVEVEDVADHVMHAEHYSVPEETMNACAVADRVVAVGTTTLRALETVALSGELCGTTRLFVHGEFQFKVVDLLLTNFHQPRSSMLMLVDAFYGPRWRELYATALSSDYRFLSFGDAMLLGRGAGRMAVAEERIATTVPESNKSGTAHGCSGAR